MIRNIRDLNWGKLGSNWEVSYRVTSMVGIRAYYLEDLEEIPLLGLENFSNLEKYFY